MPCGAALKALLVEIIESPEVYKKIIGMQMLVEGLAMGAFANGYRYNRDPVARKLFQLVMTDEAFHHKFGKIWADRTIPKLTESRAQHGRGLGGALRPVAAVQQRLARAAAGDLRPVRPRSERVIADIMEAAQGSRSDASASRARPTSSAC